MTRMRLLFIIVKNNWIGVFFFGNLEEIEILLDTDVLWESEKVEKLRLENTVGGAPKAKTPTAKIQIEKAVSNS